MENEKIHREVINHCKKYDYTAVLTNLYGKSEYYLEVKELEKKYFIYGKWKFWGRLLVDIQAMETLVEEDFKGGLIPKKHYYLLKNNAELEELENAFIQLSIQPQVMAQEKERKLKENINNALKEEYKNSKEIIDDVYELILDSRTLKDENLLKKMDEVNKYVKRVTDLNKIFNKGKNFYSTLKKI